MIPNVQSSSLPKDLLDPVFHDPLVKAVSLVPCGHTCNEDTAIQLINRGMPCPLERERFTQYVPNYAVRNLVCEALKQPTPPKPGQSLEASALLAKASSLASQNKLEEAISALLAALTLNPKCAASQALLEKIFNDQISAGKKPCRLDSSNQNAHGIQACPPSENLQKSFRWYKSGADQGNLDAICKVGICYFEGDGVEQDYEQAAKCFKEAAEGGNAGAKEIMDKIHSF